MPPAKSKAKAAVETRSFQEIIAARLPKRPTVRERLAAAVEARSESRAKIAAQEGERKARDKAREKVARLHRPGTSDYYRALAEERAKA
jgi:hypothetical protein